MSSIARPTSYNNDLSAESGASRALNPKKYFLRINKGSGQGTVFQLKSNEILIGRDPSNHIELKNDSRVSRKHVRISYSDNRYVIQDITKNNFISVNGIKLKQAALKNNHIIQIGNHTLQFIISSEPSAPNQSSSSKTGGTNPLRLVLFALLALGGAAYFLMPSGTKTTSSKSKFEASENPGKVEKRIEDIDETIKKLDEKIKSSSKFNEIGRSAESIYIQGKRDFDRGQYAYSMSAFQAVLSLNPEHAEARRYLRLAEQYFSNLIELQFRNGLTQRETGQYTECMASMENIMNLINDPSSPRFEEAKKVFLECELKRTSGGL